MRETDGRGEGRTEGGKRGGQVGAASTGRKDARGHGAAATRPDEARRHRAAPGPAGQSKGRRRLACASSWGGGAALSAWAAPRWVAGAVFQSTAESSLQPQGSNSLAHSRYRTDSSPRTDLSASLAQRYPVPEVGRREHGDTCLAHFSRHL